ncbi:MAG: hypothetical protein KA190_09185 [Kofleriaceae bacterium]|nr:hypothetical protein [Kofleriaceae bacterium]
MTIARPALCAATVAASLLLVVGASAGQPMPAEPTTPPVAPTPAAAPAATTAPAAPAAPADEAPADETAPADEAPADETADETPSADDTVWPPAREPPLTGYSARAESVMLWLGFSMGLPFGYDGDGCATCSTGNLLGAGLGIGVSRSSRVLLAFDTRAQSDNDGVQAEQYMGAARVWRSDRHWLQAGAGLSVFGHQVSDGSGGQRRLAAYGLALRLATGFELGGPRRGLVLSASATAMLDRFGERATVDIGLSFDFWLLRQPPQRRRWYDD